MAKPREIKRKILTIGGTRKLTHTMELVATSRSKQNQARMQAARLYADGMAALVAELAGGEDIAHPLIGAPDAAAPAAVVVITSNRGLCGGFNAQILRAAEAVLDALAQTGAAARVYMIGKRGAARFRHAGREVEWFSAAFDDRPKVADAGALADRLTEAFLAGAVGKVEVVSARFRSAGQQPVEVTPLLPIAPPAQGAPHGGFLHHDSMEAMLDELLPRAVRTQLLRLLLESGTCEQIARRVAMKAATDSADEMLKVYRRMFNRARQSSITLELMDVIGGANAIQ
ncbi:MAG TPA: ATP synthase F1 subunit gamma [Planctomycetota bacterium]|nr:ATP synthase F1 subunit gamma [Planctomycetota bacterium]OQC21217.1 MAG: ATP synthase gamma chain [Planctomycetes bacterium ADurb.Bin069]NMD35834.1 ATP synthase F1 subunit gamma [Planctomycetota bacterium]HNR99106.1 ATP synthase F1 subunit gamma [Planctomycetota bacterium]HNU25857.1 ATP synthase F1 subunit gamma [Planctomycetota bacterium]